MLLPAREASNPSREKQLPIGLYPRIWQCIALPNWCVLSTMPLDLEGVEGTHMDVA